MTLLFLPSLEHMAAVRVALTIYKHDLIQILHEWIKIHRADLHNSFHIKTKDRWILEMKEKAVNKLSILSVGHFKNHILSLISPLVDEIFFFVRDHPIIMVHTKSIELYWKSDGTIDRIKSAKLIVRNDSVDKRIRFVMACIYFFQDDVLFMWRSMAAAERQSIFLIESNIAILFWIRWLKENATSPWIECATKYLGKDFHNTMIFYNNYHNIGRVRLSSFFSVLSTRNKKYFFHCYWPHHLHFDDLRLCYRQVNEFERAEIFHSVTNTVDVLCCFLDWPLQTLFLDELNKMKVYLSPSCFRHYLYYILTCKLMRGMHDFDYLTLLKDLWYSIDDPQKTKIRNKKGFILLRAALSYDARIYEYTIEELMKEICKFLSE